MGTYAVWIICGIEILGVCVILGVVAYLGLIKIIEAIKYFKERIM